MSQRPYEAPKRSLGQNFLVDPNIQRKIVEELRARPDDVVLEVGPGHGELSQHLIGKTRRLVLVEKDRKLAAELTTRWGDRSDVEVVEADALMADLSDVIGGAEPIRVVSNVPYNVTSPLIFVFLGIRPRPVRCVLMVQREVAERVVATPGGKTYGALSVGVQTVARAGLAFRVGGKAFRPVPDVESAVIWIEPRADAPSAEDLTALRTLTRACFSRRRKQLQKILRTAPELDFVGDPTEMLSALDLDPRSRPEILAPDAFVALARALGEWRERPRPR